MLYFFIAAFVLGVIILLGYLLYQYFFSGPGWVCMGDYQWPVRLNEDRDVQCMTKDGNTCVKGNCQDNLNLPEEEVSPITCGSDHKNRFGTTGYDDVNHWCYKTLKMFHDQQFG